MSDDPDSPQATRSWLQFSLRGLLVLTALIAAFFGWREWRARPARLQAEAMVALRSAGWEIESGGSVEVTSKIEAKLLEWLAIERPTAISMIFPLRDAQSPWVLTSEQIAALEPVQCLYVNEISARDLARFRGLSSLASLSCDLKDVDAAVAEIAAWSSLQEVYLGCESLSEEQAALLAKLPELRDLRLKVAHVAPFTIAAFRGGKVQALRIEGAGWQDRDIADISGLATLEFLHFGNCPAVTPRCIAGLNDLPRLRHLSLPFTLGDSDRTALAQRFPVLEGLYSMESSTNLLEVRRQ